MQTVTLTFDLARWFLFMTQRLVMVIICAKLYSNLTMHNKVIGRTRTGSTEVYAQSLSVDCDLDLCPSDMVLVRDTSSCHDDHSCQIIIKSTMHNRVMGRTRTGFTEVYAQNLRADCDVDL